MRSFWFYRSCVPFAELTRNAVDVLPKGELEKKLATGRQLRVKLGIDVTSPDIHLGRGIPLQRMRAFQEEGHKAVLIIGDYTTRIGDPSGRSSERPILSDAEIDANAQKYLDQAKVILIDDPDRLEVRFNGEWLSKLSYADVVGLCRTITVARMLERDDFEKRFNAKEPISVSELLYPLMQAYDSVAVKADIELGGTDQLYNLLAGRDVMAAYGLEPQAVMTTPLLLSWDGEKMSSSQGNNIPLTAPAEEMFGRTMRIPDSMLPDWYGLIAERPVAEADPMAAKLELARWITARSWGDDAAAQAAQHFDRVVRQGEAPAEVPDAVFEAKDGVVYLPGLLVSLAGNSASHWRRAIDQGGVKVDGGSVAAYEVDAAMLDGALLQAGKRQFFRLKPA